MVSFPSDSSIQYPIRIYTPTNLPSNSILPVILYFHGDYWVSGGLNSKDLGCRAIIAHGNAVLLISFSYWLGPESDWRSIFSDAENALKWTAAHAADFGGDVSKGFIVSGATSGAQLAAICAIRARNRLRGVRLTGHRAHGPVVVGPRRYPDSGLRG